MKILAFVVVATGLGGVAAHAETGPCTCGDAPRGSRLAAEHDEAADAGDASVPARG